MKLTAAKRIFTAVSMLAAFSVAHAYPDKSITIIVPFNAGTVNDINARDLADRLAEQTGEAVVVENRVGAEGTIGGQRLLSQAADGHTLMFTSNSLTVFDPLMKKNIPYDPVNDFAPVCAVARTSHIVNVSGEGPHKTLNDLVTAAKADPGKLTFAYTSSSMRLSGELFAQSAGIELTSVPYKSSVTGMTDVSSGRVDMVIIDQLSARPFHESGKLVPLIVAGETRLPDMPEVPSAAEAGVANYNMKPWFGVYASAKTPPELLDKARDMVRKTLSSPALIAGLKQRGLEPFPVCGDEMNAMLQEERKVMQQVVERAKIEKQ